MTLDRPLEPHKSRVVVAGIGAGMVVAVLPVARVLRAGVRVDAPARVHVVFDSGARLTVNVSEVELES